jgi:hypothetical protein
LPVQRFVTIQPGLDFDDENLLEDQQTLQVLSSIMYKVDHRAMIQKRNQAIASYDGMDSESNQTCFPKLSNLINISHKSLRIPKLRVGNGRIPLMKFPKNENILG